MLEKWKMASNNKEAFGTLLTDLSKAFDCFDNELSIAKLHAYGRPISFISKIGS